MTDTPAKPRVSVTIGSNPCPRATVEGETGADNATITLYRHDSTGSAVVRGAYHYTATGAYSFTDYEIPFGESVTYTAVGTDCEGIDSASSNPSDPVTIASQGNRACPWITDPIRPASAQRVRVLNWQKREYGRDITLHWPVSATRATAVMGPQREPVSEMEALTLTDTQASSLRTMLAIPVIYLRPDPSWGWSAAYYAVSDLTEQRVNRKNAADQRRRWEFTLTPVAAPSPIFRGTLYAWVDLLTLYTTWRDVLSTKSTWLDVLRNPDPGSVS